MLLGIDIYASQRSSAIGTGAQSDDCLPPPVPLLCCSRKLRFPSPLSASPTTMTTIPPPDDTAEHTSGTTSRNDLFVECLDQTEIIAHHQVENVLDHTVLPSFGPLRNTARPTGRIPLYNPLVSLPRSGSASRPVRFSPPPTTRLRDDSDSDSSSHGAALTGKGDRRRSPSVRRQSPTVRARTLTPGGGGDNSSDEESKIPKPKGEAARPGRGGYNLQKVLNWSSDDYDAIRVS